MQLVRLQNLSFRPENRHLKTVVSSSDNQGGTGGTQIFIFRQHATKIPIDLLYNFNF